MKRTHAPFVVLFIFAVHALLSLNSSRTRGEDAEASRPRRRTFLFHYSATTRDLPRSAKLRVWVPVPPSNKHQQIKRLNVEGPGKMREETERKYGNKMLYFEATAPASGSLSFETSYQVKRAEVAGLARERIGDAETLSEMQKNNYLASNSKVPIGGKPAELVSGMTLPNDPLRLGRELYLRVDQHMRYDKSKPGYGNGDVLWACDSRFGNCTDFHSLFISLARFKGIPARFEIGFPLPAQRGKGKIDGYHCWAFFFVKDRGWVPVDISEADRNPEMKDYFFGNLTENRVAFTVGRDLVLSPAQAGPPLNYFVYPHIEVDGNIWPKEKIELRFEYADL